MKKFCLIYANCQNLLLAKYLSGSEEFNQQYLIKRLPIHLYLKNETTIPDHLLKEAKLFIYQPVHDIHGDRSTQSILKKLPSDCQTISFPPLYFKGYFPQYCRNPVNHVIAPNYPYGLIPHGDSNIISMLEEGKSKPEIVERLSDPNFYSKEFLLNNLNETLGELARRESQLSIKVSSFIEAHFQHYNLFHTQNHPTDMLGIYVVNQILKLINLPSLSSELSILNPIYETLNNFQIPIYPSVIRHLNLTFVNPKTLYKHGSYCTNQMTFARYISEYIDLHLSTSDSSKAYHFQGIEYAKQNKFNEASDALKKAIKIKPDNATLYGELGNVLRKQNKLDQAEKVYKKAIELSSDWVDFYKSLAEILVKKNNFKAAILTCKQALMFDPINDKLYGLLGDALVEYGELELGITAYNKALKLDPTNAYYHRCLGDIYQNQNNLSFAILNYEKAIAIAPNNPWLYIHLSNALVKQNKLDEAITICQQATKFKRRNPSFYSHLGNIQLQTGDVDSALDTYKQAIKLNPNQMERIFVNLGNFIQENATPTNASVV